MSYSKNFDFPAPAVKYGYFSAAAPPHNSLTRYSATKTIRRNMTGNINPKWRQQVEDGVNATTAFTGQWSTVKTKRGMNKYECHSKSNPNVTRKALVYGELAYYPQTEPSWVGGWTSRAESTAASRFLQKVDSAQHKMTGGVFLGEVKQTLKMLTQPAYALEQGVNRYLRHVKEANRHNRRHYFRKKPKTYARNLSHIASGLWLEHALGWMPFLNDISDARDAYNSLFDKDRVMKVSAGGQDSFEGSKPTSSYYDAGGTSSGLWTVATSHRTEVETIRFRGAIRARAATTAQDRLARYGFSVAQFIPTAWELLPWSFLIDYFANVGDLIQSSCVDRSSIMWTNRSRIRQTTLVTTVSPNKERCKSLLEGTGWVLDEWVGSTSQSVWRRRYVDRAVAAIPSPSLQFYLPGSAKRLFNIAALMVTVGLDTHPQRLSKRTFRL